MEAVRNFNVREFILGTAITTSLFLVVVLSPVIGFVFCLLAPLPIALFTWRMGRVPGITMLLLSIGLLAAVFKIGGFVESLPFFLVLGSAGILIPEVLRRGYGIEAAVGLSAAAYLALIGSALLGYSLAVDRSVADIVRSYVDESVRYSLALYEEIGIPREQIEQFKESAPEVAAWVVNHGLALLVTGVTFFVWLNVLGLRLLSQGRDPAFPDFGDLACWKMPDWVVWFVIAAGAAMIVPEEAAQVAGLNVLIVALFLYLLQGLSIVQFFFRQKNIPRYLRALFYALIVLYQYLLVFVSAVGLFDIWVDFRKMNRPASDTT
ncbi:MAG TPA: YybS family protein, partial [Syntrophales bacterium]|nr:YybS family protein [Syntrophales bacterium]